jgi:hypothetical protein
MRGISLLVDQLTDRYPAVRSIWVIGSRADGDELDSHGPFDWELVAFADAATLRSLRRATDLHRADVFLRVVTDGDRFEMAWGRPQMSGSLFQWDWREATEHQAYYSEARWRRPAGTGNVERVRRSAACLWRSEPGASRFALVSPHRDATRTIYN